MINPNLFSDVMSLDLCGVAILTNPFEKNFYKNLVNDYQNFPFEQAQSIPDDNPNQNLSLLAETIDFGYYATPHNNRNKLTPAWENLFKQAASEEYKKGISNIMGIDLMRCKTRLEMAIYPKSGHLSAHTDREPNKVLTQLFYLNEHWDTSWGGMFCVLNAKKTSEVIMTIPPLYTHSVLVLADEKSWHEVTPVVGPEARKIAAIEYYYQQA